MRKSAASLGLAVLVFIALPVLAFAVETHVCTELVFINQYDKYESESSALHEKITIEKYICVECNTISEKTVSINQEEHNMVSWYTGDNYHKNQYHYATMHDICGSCNYDGGFREDYYRCPGDESGNGCILPWSLRYRMMIN